MAGNSKDSKILEYKDMINQLNKTIAAQTELIPSLQKTLEADRLEKETLRQQIEYLTKKLFGASSEKRKDIEGQLNLFDEAEQEADPAWKPELPDDITVPEHKRKARRTPQNSLKMCLSAMRSFLFQKRNGTVQPAEHRWNVLEKNSSVMSSGLLQPKGKW